MSEPSERDLRAATRAMYAHGDSPEFPDDPPYSPAETRIAIAIADLMRAAAGPIGVGWETIESAPTDGQPVWVYVAMAYGLPPFEDRCSWHQDAGWCADELRPVTHWNPETTQILRDAVRYRLLKERLGDQLDEAKIDTEVTRDAEGGDRG